MINLNFIPIVVYKIRKENSNLYKQGNYLGGEVRWGHGYKLPTSTLVQGLYTGSRCEPARVLPDYYEAICNMNLGGHKKWKETK